MKEMNFSSFLKMDIECFIAHKNALGFPYEQSARHLLDFDKMCRERFAGHTILDSEIALAWAERKSHEHPNTLIRRISPVRGLAEHMNRMGKIAYMIPKGLPNHEEKYIPHIYTEEEIASLLAAADRLTPQKGGCVKHLVIPCVLRLLYATGMRHGEARLLKTDDVDFKAIGTFDSSPAELKNALSRPSLPLTPLQRAAV
jgi:integrase